uniref:Uncharacterized protein n=1 Tax=Glossina palpalis gambiensis TaxID=67801 RepID=A0A1B0C5M1_9MUSC
MTITSQIRVCCLQCVALHAHPKLITQIHSVRILKTKMKKKKKYHLIATRPMHRNQRNKNAYQQTKRRTVLRRLMKILLTIMITALHAQ